MGKELHWSLWLDNDGNITFRVFQFGMWVDACELPRPDVCGRFADTTHETIGPA